MGYVMIVEGKNDRAKLRRLLTEEVRIVCTFGTPGPETIERLRRDAQHDEVFIFTDNDKSGRKIRFLMAELFPDAVHLYTKRGYAGVEGTPDEYLLEQLDKHGLGEFLRTGGAPC
jgi:toprim domain protein